MQRKKNEQTNEQTPSKELDRLSEEQFSLMTMCILVMSNKEEIAFLEIRGHIIE